MQREVDRDNGYLGGGSTSVVSAAEVIPGEFGFDGYPSEEKALRTEHTCIRIQAGVLVTAVGAVS